MTELVGCIEFHVTSERNLLLYPKNEMFALIPRYAHRPINPDDPPALKQSRPDHPYRTVGCVFNHKSFYANSQVQERSLAWERARVQREIAFEKINVQYSVLYIKNNVVTFRLVIGYLKCLGP